MSEIPVTMETGGRRQRRQVGFHSGSFRALGSQRIWWTRVDILEGLVFKFGVKNRGKCK